MRSSFVFSFSQITEGHGVRRLHGCPIGMYDFDGNDKRLTERSDRRTLTRYDFVMAGLSVIALEIRCPPSAFPLIRVKLHNCRCFVI